MPDFLTNDILPFINYDLFITHDIAFLYISLNPPKSSSSVAPRLALLVADGFNFTAKRRIQVFFSQFKECLSFGVMVLDTI
jgi:hypothetical protein